ncbi:hypothetical protein T265_11746 [Opisthorchis viverrini]|uniref:Immunoglobulin I-set domain-containing protein n=1 Tax=Opisthorchis viverrini TaxID=6198 RepID=A0A074YXV7_OPIVI|nr:hypothetical protein T265_11746 [Opisthorchis viverrini]KER19503.1 hypothetical protein T265_11746 [Opisthorchis viverrini]
MHLAVAWFGNPEPSVTWDKDGVPVDQQDGFVVLKRSAPLASDLGHFGRLEQPNSGTSILQFKGVRRQDRGNYRLILENEHGQVQTTYAVDVIGKLPIVHLST